MCRALKVSASGYYALCRRPECDRIRETHRLDAFIKAEFEAAKKRDSSIKIAKKIQNKGKKVSRCKVARRMRHMAFVQRSGRNSVRQRTLITVNRWHRIF
jgi:putative transposase